MVQLFGFRESVRKEKTRKFNLLFLFLFLFLFSFNLIYGEHSLRKVNSFVRLFWAEVLSSGSKGCFLLFSCIFWATKQ